MTDQLPIQPPKYLRKGNAEFANREAIEQYLIAEDDTVELNEEQKRLYERWREVDELIREGGKKRGDIANYIKEKYGVSRTTAFKDIVNAEYVFSSAAPLNKKYRVGIQIEAFEGYIKDAAKEGDWKDVASLGKVLATFYDIYPDQQALSNTPRTVIMQVLQQNIVHNTGLPSIEEAMSIVDSELINILDDE